MGARNRCSQTRIDGAGFKPQGDRRHGDQHQARSSAGECLRSLCSGKGSYPRLHDAEAEEGSDLHLRKKEPSFWVMSVTVLMNAEQKLGQRQH